MTVASIIKAESTISKYAGARAIKLTLLTEKGIMQKTMNITSRECELLYSRYGSNLADWQDEKIPVELSESKSRKGWYDVNLIPFEQLSYMSL